MVNIDAIMALLDWNNSAEQQERGIELAKNVKCINVFLQPNQREYGKNVWDIAPKFYPKGRIQSYLHTWWISCVGCRI